jgi:hypothetical protein
MHFTAVRVVQEVALLQYLVKPWGPLIIKSQSGDWQAYPFRSFHFFPLAPLRSID